MFDLIDVTQNILSGLISTRRFKHWQPSEPFKADRAGLEVVRPEQPQPPGRPPCVGDEKEDIDD